MRSPGTVHGQRVKRATAVYRCTVGACCRHAAAFAWAPLQVWKLIMSLPTNPGLVASLTDGGKFTNTILGGGAAGVLTLSWQGLYVLQTAAGCLKSENSLDVARRPWRSAFLASDSISTVMRFFLLARGRSSGSGGAVSSPVALASPAGSSAATVDGDDLCLTYLQRATTMATLNILLSCAKQVRRPL